MPLISNCSMMPEWHQLVSMSGHVEESETARNLQLYATSIYQVHSFVCQLDYCVSLVLRFRKVPLTMFCGGRRRRCDDNITLFTISIVNHWSIHNNCFHSFDGTQTLFVDSENYCLSSEGRRFI